MANANDERTAAKLNRQTVSLKIRKGSFAEELGQDSPRSNVGMKST